VTSKGLRLLAYGRVSDVRGRSGESFISPEDQMAKCRAYADAYEHAILEEGLDLDVSGGVMSRPVLDRFLAKIRNGEAQGLIVAKLDRFSRSSRGALNALAEIEAAGGVLISVQEQIDSTTAAGRFVRAIFLATAEWERDRIGENWTAAQKSAVERGIHISRHVPPGYVRNGGGKLKPHRKHGATITKAYEMAAAGVPPARIARYLNERGLPSGDNEQAVWKSSRIKRLLANRVYLGEARYGDFTNPDAHDPLTDETTWLRAQRKPATPPVSPTSSYLLSGIVR
jgi:DNA invertase Pin-like site-specific DNA recombinase